MKKVLLLLILAMVMTTSAIAQNLLANYTFSGNAQDAALTANHGTVSGAVLTQDRFGFANNAYLFNGLDAYIEAPNQPSWNTDYTTVSFWINANSIPGQGEVYILSFGGWQERFKISLPNHGKLIWTTNYENGISDMDPGDGNELVPGTWYHVVMIHDGVKDKIFFNGALVAEKDVDGKLNATDNMLGIGFDANDRDYYFDGKLDEVQIYDAAMTDQQVMDLYNAQNQNPGITQDIVALYPFDGNAEDISNYHNTATVSGATLTTDQFGFGNSAYSFDGVDDYIKASASAQLNSDYTTVSFWVKVDELPAQGEVYLLSNGGWQERWKISLPSHGKPIWTTNHENGISDMDAGDGNELEVGVWTHVVMMHDDAKDKIFINGVLANEKVLGGKLNSTDKPFGMGYDPINNANFFKGSLDYVTVYSTVYTDQQIADLYAAQSQNPADPVDLVAYYPFQGNTNDMSQYGNHALPDGASPAMDRFGFGNNAYYFDGTSTMTAANSPALNSDYTTVSFWVNVEELPAQGEYYLLSFGGWQQRFKISLPSHGKPVWTTNHENGISDMDSGDGNALVPGTWTHVAMVHDGVKDKIFFNGVLVADKDVAGKLNSTTHPLGIGYNAVDGGSNFFGMLDDIAIFNVALTDQQITDLYGLQSTAPVIPDGMVAYYPFKGNTADMTDFRNHAFNRGAFPAKDRFDRANHAYSWDGELSEMMAMNSVQLNSDLASISFWVNVNELPSQGESYLMSFGGWQERFKISLPQHGKPVFTTNHTNGISDMDSGDGNELVIGEWTHVVMVHDGAKDNIYFDGELVAEKDVDGLLNSTTHPLGFGYNAVDGGSLFNGMLDDIQLYNIALDSQAVADLYELQSEAPVNPDTIAPTAPTDLAAVVNFTDVFLNWKAATDDVGVMSYNVYQDEVLTATTPNLFMNIMDLTPLTDFVFEVTAVDSSGNESLPARLNVTSGSDPSPDTIPPTMPANFAGDAGSQSVILSWEASVDDRQLGGYVLTQDGVFLDSLDANATSKFVGGLDPLTNYTFANYAYDAAGNVSPTATINITTDEEVQTSEPGLVAFYKFENNTADETPYQNHGAIGGDPVYEAVTGRPNADGMAIVFDGDGDSVLAQNAVQLISDFTTVSFWVRVDGQNTNDAEAYILNFGHWNERWKISLPQHLKVVWTTNSKNDQFDHAISDMDSGDGNELTLGFWWHVTMVHDGTDDIIYIDGIEVNRKEAKGTLNATSRPFGMASNTVDGGQYFEGALDEVKVYNRAITADEALTLYEKGTVVGTHNISSALNSFIRQAYPNPVMSDYNIEHMLPIREELLIRIFDLQGRQVDMLRYDPSNLYSTIRIDTRDYLGGEYFANFVLDGQNLGSIRFVKQ